MKRCLKEQRFEDLQVAKRSIKTWLRKQPSVYFQSGLTAWSGALLRQYVVLEAAVARAERRLPLERYNVRQEELERHRDHLLQLEAAEYDARAIQTSQTKKEERDKPSNFDYTFGNREQNFTRTSAENFNRDGTKDRPGLARPRAAGHERRTGGRHLRTQPAGPWLEARVAGRKSLWSESLPHTDIEV
ncbi:hypothetical protein LAZ67_X000618 [Cordylochernes scorpioides]|uniref:Uncharacterized protein n=1 Tax=Cordylochernes scorpioides TaxID=51811 RepID=A0ABY6LWL7_9ARAC|nr:hypothetical protein LAZ67_X000618 [Cordylochernes scorpioides]